MTKIKLCIDPGHGMSNTKPGLYDPGAQAGGLAEADITLQWALTLQWVCQQNGIETWMTRSDDRTADPVGSRDDRAEAHGCTHFIAIHCNCGGGQGAEAFYRDDKDKKLADLLLKATVQAMGTKDRGLKTEGASQHTRLAVFDFDGPCSLIEIGFIDNSFDSTRMTKRDVRLAWAQSLVLGLKRLYS